MSGYHTENYVVQGDHKPWERHSTVGILRAYANHISGNVIDIGCNSGGITYWLHENKNVKSVTGVDINLKVKEHFERIMTGTNLPFKFICANLVEETINEGEYDTAISFHALEHIFPKDANNFVKNSTARLKTGGKMIVSIPYMNAYEDPHHREFYDEKKLTDVFQRNGFNVIECFLDNSRWHEKNILTALFVKK